MPYLCLCLLCRNVGFEVAKNKYETYLVEEVHNNDFHNGRELLDNFIEKPISHADYIDAKNKLHSKGILKNKYIQDMRRVELFGEPLFPKQ